MYQIKKLGDIKNQFTAIDETLFLTIGADFDYHELTDKIIEIANNVNAYCNDHPETDTLWNIGEFGSCTIVDFIVGAYWHFTEWHDGQSSNSYAALCALGQVFRPGLSCSEPDNEAYIALGEMALETI